MMETKMTAIDLLNETREYYRTHQRGVSSTSTGGCQYLTEAGHMCGVGRCFSDEGRELFGGFDGYVLDLLDEMIGRYGTPYDFFKPQYHHLLNDLTLWESIQTLHDNDAHWVANETGGCDLTDWGVRFFNGLIEEYS